MSDIKNYEKEKKYNYQKLDNSFDNFEPEKLGKLHRRVVATTKITAQSYINDDDSESELSSDNDNDDIVNLDRDSLLTERQKQVKIYAAYLTHYYYRFTGFLWLVSAYVLLYVSNLFEVLYKCEPLHSPLFYLMTTTFFIMISFYLYIDLIHPFVGFKVDLSSESILIPILTGISVIFCLLFVLSLWPAFGVWGIAFLACSLIGFPQIAAYVPAPPFGSIIMLIIFVATLASPYYIEHDGMLHDFNFCSPSK